MNFRLLMILLTVFSISVADAGTDSTGSATFCKVVTLDEEMRYSLIYKAAQKTDVTVQLLDEKNNVVYTEKVKSAEAFTKQYDLSRLPYGMYELVVKAGEYSFTEKIDVGGLSDFHLVLSGQQTDRAVTLLGSCPEGKEMTLYIYDENEELIYTENFSETSTVTKKYNLEKIEGDQVTFLIYHNDSLIKHEIFGF